jgi:general secretion pathway protein L
MSDTTNSATRQVSALFVRAWRWARGCASALVSDLAAPRAGGGDSKAVLVLGGQGATLLARRKGHMAPVGGGGQSIEAMAQSAKSTLSRSEQQALTLRFAEDRAIVQEMQLPEGARPLLGAILKNKIESLAPWPIEDTAWGYATGPVTRAGMVPVTIGIVGRRALASPLLALAAAGLKPARVEIAAGEEAIVIDHSSDARRRKVSTVMRMALGSLAILITAGGAYGGLLAWRDNQELAALAERTEQLKRELAGRNSDGADGGQVAEAVKLVDGKKDQRPMVAVLDALTKAIPNGSWLTAVDYVDGTLTIQGRGGPPTDLIKSLEAAETFSNVNFAAATQRDDEAGADVYAISATLEPIAVAP